jgi:hypothetical protein
MSRYSLLMLWLEGDVSEHVDLTAAIKLAELARPVIPTFLIVKLKAALLAYLN